MRTSDRTLAKRIAAISGTAMVALMAYAGLSALPQALAQETPDATNPETPLNSQVFEGPPAGHRPPPDFNGPDGRQGPPRRGPEFDDRRPPRGEFRDDRRSSRGDRDDFRGPPPRGGRDDFRGPPPRGDGDRGYNERGRRQGPPQGRYGERGGRGDHQCEGGGSEFGRDQRGHRGPPPRRAGRQGDRSFDNYGPPPRNDYYGSNDDHRRDDYRRDDRQRDARQRSRDPRGERDFDRPRDRQRPRPDASRFEDIDSDGNGAVSMEEYRNHFDAR